MPGKVYYQELEDWNRNAAFYEQQNESPFQQILLEQMTQTYGLSDCGGMLLDLGGGVGSFASRLDGAGTVALCVDFSMEMLLAARRRNPRIRCLCASADSLPFRESSFAAAVCNGTLHHVKVQDLLPEAVKELVRVLRPGATLCIQDRHNGAMSNLAEAALGSLKTMHR
ncbi:MAG: class I SAM-dependent methyltransferase, partial [Dehalococcoidia bacterium]|nr:class I SAM-dependent methyltransferase [Dehalococcoidia bacterium]